MYTTSPKAQENTKEKEAEKNKSDWDIKRVLRIATF